jgi:hypothetical protein
MANSADKRSPLLWVLILVVAAACMLCVLCAGGSAGMYFFFRPTGQERTSGPTIYPTSTSTPSAATATEPMPATPTQNESVASPTSAATPDPDVWRQMGNPNAKVVIEEFADYQCPYCGEFHTDGEPRLRTEYIQTGKVRFIFRCWIGAIRKAGNLIWPRWARFVRANRASSGSITTRYLRTNREKIPVDSPPRTCWSLH